MIIAFLDEGDDVYHPQALPIFGAGCMAIGQWGNALFIFMREGCMGSMS